MMNEGPVWRRGKPALSLRVEVVAGESCRTAFGYEIDQCECISAGRLIGPQVKEEALRDFGCLIGFILRHVDPVRGVL